MLNPRRLLFGAIRPSEIFEWVCQGLHGSRKCEGRAGALSVERTAISEVEHVAVCGLYLWRVFSRELSNEARLLRKQTRVIS